MKENEEKYSDILKTTISGSTLKGKIRSLILLISILSVILIISVFYGIQRINNQKVYRNSLETLIDTKAKALEDHYSKLIQSVELAATNYTLIDAFDNLKNAYKNLREENSIYELSVREKIPEKLIEYYDTEVVPKYLRIGINVSANQLLPDNKIAQFVQYYYLMQNQYPFSKKSKMSYANDGTEYSMIHQEYHSLIRKTRTQLGASNVYFIDDNSGNVVYTFEKYPDFATNLYDDYYRNSKLAMIFKKALGLDESVSPVLSEYELYPGKLFMSVQYIAIPMHKNGIRIGILIVEFSPDSISTLVQETTTQNDIKSGKDVCLISSDGTFKSNSYLFNYDKKTCLDKLSSSKANLKLINKIDSLGTLINMMSLDKKIQVKNITGISGNFKARDIYGNRSLFSYKKLNIFGLDRYIIAKYKIHYIQQSANTIIFIGIGILVMLFLIALLISNRFLNHLHQSLISLQKSLSKILEGEFSLNLDKKNHAELSNLNNLLNSITTRYKEASEYAIKLSDGNIEKDFKTFSQNDVFGQSLNQIKESLIKNKKEQEERSKEDDIRRWISEGDSKFNDILRRDNNDINKLSYNVLKNLLDFVSANQGGVFLIDEDNENKLVLVCAYAYDRQKYLEKEIPVGEGLIGNCVLEKKAVYLKKVPEDYMEITSGLGQAVPRELLIVPMIEEEKVLGIIEIAAFKEFEQYEIDFIEKVAANFALTLRTVRLNMQTAKLLEESNKRSEELSQSEEEIRQNMEELKATQEEIARIKKQEEIKEAERREAEKKFIQKLKEQHEKSQAQQEELEKEKYLIDALLENLPEHIYFKDMDSRFIKFSKSMLRLFGLKKEDELLGKTDFDFFDDEHARPAFDAEQRIIKTGQAIIDLIEKEVKKDGSIEWVNTTKMPLRDKDGKIVGTFGISKNITKTKKLEEQAESTKTELALHLKLLNSLTERIVIVDKEGTVILANEQFAIYKNMPIKDIIGKNYYKLFSQKEAEVRMRNEEEALKMGGKVWMEERGRRKIQINIAPLKLKDIKLDAMLRIEDDVTDIVKSKGSGK